MAEIDLRGRGDWALGPIPKGRYMRPLLHRVDGEWVVVGIITDDDGAAALMAALQAAERAG